MSRKRPPSPPANAGRGDKGSARPDQGGRGERPAPRFGRRSDRRSGGGAASAGRGGSGDRTLLYGYHPVREALRAGRREITRLFATEAAAERLADELAARGVTPQIVAAEDLTARLGPEAVHQGVLAEASPLPDLDLSELSGKGVVLVLDQVTDPHNVGAILRTAAAFGVEALVTTERHSPAFTGVLAKSASGGLEHVAIISVVNLARALEELGDIGYTRVGLDSEGPEALGATDLSPPLALVLGAEGKGLRRLTRENCDRLARLDMPGAIKSLNVSNACAVALTLVAFR